MTDFEREVILDPDALRRWCKVHFEHPPATILSRPRPLGGGLLNHVWMVDAAPSPFVLKWSPDHIASAPSIALDPRRSCFEARALELLAETPSLAELMTSSGVRAPALLASTRDPWVIAMEYVEAAGDITQRATSRGFEQDARDLGIFIGALHAQTEGDLELARAMRNDSVQETRAVVQYDALAQWLSERGRGMEAETLRALGQRFLQPGCCLIMGDLWPPSVLVSARDELVIIDWEFSHYGHPAQDVGHLCAHLWLGWRRTGVSRFREQLDAFLVGYTSRNALSPAAWRCTSQHFGAELLARTVGAFAIEGLEPARVERVVEDALDAMRDPLSGIFTAFVG